MLMQIRVSQVVIKVATNILGITKHFLTTVDLFKADIFWDSPVTITETVMTT